jgi:hypothetical protein
MGKGLALGKSNGKQFRFGRGPVFRDFFNSCLSLRFYNSKEWLMSDSATCVSKDSMGSFLSRLKVVALISVLLVFHGGSLRAQPTNESVAAGDQRLTPEQRLLENAIREHLAADAVIFYASEMREESFKSLFFAAGSVLKGDLGSAPQYYDVVFDVSKDHNYFRLNCTLLRYAHAPDAAASATTGDTNEYRIYHRTCVVARKTMTGDFVYSSIFAMASAGFDVYAGGQGSNMLLFQLVK